MTLNDLAPMQRIFSEFLANSVNFRSSPRAPSTIIVCDKT